MLGSLFDGNYQITDDGQLFSVRSGKWLKPSEDRYGYLYYVVSIGSNRHTIKAHRAVAQCFVPNPDNKPTVDHINADKKDNRACNLRWATRKEQKHNPLTEERMKRVWESTNYQEIGAIRDFGRKQTAVIKDGKLVGTYPSLKTAAESVSVCYSKASMCANGKRNETGGYSFCYV